MSTTTILMRVRRVAAGALLLAACCAPVRPAAAASPEPTELSRGRAALEDGLYDLAERQLRDYLGRARGDAEDNVEAVVLLARALDGQRKYAQMLEALKPRKTWRGKVEDAGAFAFWRGMARYRMGEFDAALAEVDGFAVRFPADPNACRVLRLRAACHLAKGLVTEALTSYEAFDRACPDAEEARANLLDWGRALVQAGREADAEAVLTRLVVSNGVPSRLVQEGRLWLGRALINQKGRGEEARGVLRGVCRDPAANPEVRAEAWFAVARVEESFTNLAAAVAALTNGIASAGSPETRSRGNGELGRVYVRSGRLDEGMPLVKAFIAALPADPGAGPSQLALASALLDAGRHEDAVREFQYYLEAYADKAGQATAYEGKGWGLLKLGRNGEAAVAFQKAFDLHTEPVAREQALFKVGDACFANAQYRLAQEAYDRVASDFPQGALAGNAVIQSAECLARQGQAAQAVERLRALSAERAGDPLGEEALFRAAAVWDSEGRWKDAVQGYTELLAAYTNGAFRARALNARGLACYRDFKFADAAADFGRVVAEYPASEAAEQALYLSALSDYGLLHDQAAVATCRDFVVKHPASKWLPEVRFWLGKYEYNRGEYAEAEKQFGLTATNKASGALADDALLWAGLAAAKQKEYVRSVDYFTRLVRDYPDSPRIVEARFHQADALSGLGQFSAAILILDEIVTKYPESELVPAAWGRKGDCQFTLGTQDPARYEESIASYRKVTENPAAQMDLAIHASYKIGRSLEKLGREREAVDQYYLNVVLRYLEERKKGVWHDQKSQMWFTRAAFDLADLLESQGDWRGVANVLPRVIEAGVPAADEARKRLEKIRAERWWLF